MPANQGAASALSRWCSHSRPINHSNNIFSALGLHHLMMVGCIAERSRSDLSAFIDTNYGLPYLALSFIYCSLVLPIRCLVTLIIFVALMVNEIISFCEKAIYCIIFILTMFSFLYNTRLTSFYCTFMHVVESIMGSVWQNSEIRLVTAPRKCTCNSSSKSCQEGQCYKLVEGFLYDQLNIKCECFRKHVNNRMALARERDACKTMLEQANRITACKYLWRQSELKKYCDEGCGKFNDDVLERCYDMERLMWTSVRLRTSDKTTSLLGSTGNEATSSLPVPVEGQTADVNQDKFVTLDISRDDLDEIAIVPIDKPDRLFEMPELRFAFLQNRARVESGSEIVYRPVLMLKRLLMIVVLVLQVLFASKTYQDDRTLGISIMVSSIVLNLLYSLRDRVTEDDLGGPESRVSKMLAVDAMSVGVNLIRYSNKETSWTRHKGFGSIVVGEIDVLENILYNRSLVMGDKVVSLSRGGTSMYLGDVLGNGTSRIVSGWTKVDKEKVIQATGKPLPSLDVTIGG